MTEPRLAVIQHHPSRRQLVERLTGSLEGFRVELVESELLNPPNPWVTYRRCLELACELACEGYDRALIVQDDATVCEGFAGELDAAVAEQPDAVLVLFLAASPVDLADLARAARVDRRRFVRLPPASNGVRRWLPAVAISWPMDAIADVLDWQEKYAGAHRRSDDHMLGQWTGDPYTRTPVLLTVPSLVQHPDDVISLVGNGAGARGRNPARSALFFAG